MQQEKLPNNIWQQKPWWCQPWSIALTGIGLISGSWLLLHRVWVTALVAVPVLIWMSFFLLLYPRLMQTAMAEETLNGTMTPREGDIAENIAENITEDNHYG